MIDGVELALRALPIGVVATLVMDLWALWLRAAFGVTSLNYALVGRWLGRLPRGVFVHQAIGRAEPVRGEAALGWGAHYLIGVIFAAGLLAAAGPAWAERPTLLPALIAGWITVLAPFLILQPGLGLGVAAARTPNPTQARLRSLMTHTVFGAGLYIGAWLTSRLL